MKDSSFKDLTLEMDSGDISAKSVHAEVLSLTNNFGDSTLKDFSGKEASVYIDSGDFLMEAAALEHSPEKIVSETSSFCSPNHLTATPLTWPPTWKYPASRKCRKRILL